MQELLRRILKQKSETKVAETALQIVTQPTTSSDTAEPESKKSGKIDRSIATPELVTNRQVWRIINKYENPSQLITELTPKDIEAILTYVSRLSKNVNVIDSNVNRVQVISSMAQFLKPQSYQNGVELRKGGYNLLPYVHHIEIVRIHPLDPDNTEPEIAVRVSLEFTADTDKDAQPASYSTNLYIYRDTAPIRASAKDVAPGFPENSVTYDDRPFNTVDILVHRNVKRQLASATPEPMILDQ
jgi:hypothetical protein